LFSVGHKAFGPTVARSQVRRHYHR